MKYDVVIIGAGAAGLMCAIEASKRGRKVLLLDHAKSVGEKIRISGGGRCNFTNLHVSPANYISQNPRFCVSALKRYTQCDFIKLVERYNIAYHEKTLGQLFCDSSAKQIIDMLLTECQLAGVTIELRSSVVNITKQGNNFYVMVNGSKEIIAESLVIATGGLSIPKMGSTGWGYSVAKQFGLNIIETKPALVPFTLEKKLLENMRNLSGVSLEVNTGCNNKNFREGLLFTHRGLSGPAALQISSYWQEGDSVTINLIPNTDILKKLKESKGRNPKQDIQTTLSFFVPKRLANYLCTSNNYNGRLADLSNKYLQEIANTLSKWSVTPNGTEGYRTAEVTLGGVDTDEISSKTFETKKVSGLYFIGEVVDVTGHLGGFNFQWAWSSGYASGQFV